MKRYEWMVNYTPQTVWIEDKGIFIWIALYAGIFGGGSYLIALFFHNLLGMFISWLAVLVFKGGFTILHSHYPLKLWRVIYRPLTSWISKGFIITMLFVIFGAIQLGLSFWMPGAGVEVIFEVLAGIAALGLIIYTGFTHSYVTSIPFWRSPLLPTLYVLLSLSTGFVINISVVNAMSVDITLMSTIGAVLLIISLILLFVYLFIAIRIGMAAKQSVKELVQSDTSIVLATVGLLFGILIPLTMLMMIIFVNGIGYLSFAITAAYAITIGGLAFTYLVLKVGRYNTLI